MVSDWEDVTMYVGSYTGGSGGLLSLASGLRSTTGSKYYWLVLEKNRRGVSNSSGISSSTWLVQLICRDVIELNKITTVCEGYISVTIEILY